MTPRAAGPTPWERRSRNALVAGYVIVVALGLTTEVQPRVFWTMLLPLLPMSIVLMGFPRWRRICPLAFFGELGRKLNRGTQKRVPKWLELDAGSMKGKVLSLPARDDVNFPIQEQLIVELYSK